MARPKKKPGKRKTKILQMRMTYEAYERGVEVAKLVNSGNVSQLMRDLLDWYANMLLRPEPQIPIGLVEWAVPQVKRMYNEKNYSIPPHRKGMSLTKSGLIYNKGKVVTE